MPRPQKYRDVVKFLASQRWMRLRQAKGSHEIWGSADGRMRLTIPAHKQVSAGIIGQILTQFPDAPKEWR